MMGTIFIGSGQKKKNKNGIMWKIYLSLLMFFAIVGAVLKVSAPTIVEKWLNKKGTGATGYAFLIRDVDFSISKGQLLLKDVKIFNPKTDAELLESPNLTLQYSWEDFLSQNKKVAVFADKVDLILSKDLSAELERIQESEKLKTDLYLQTIEGRFGKLNIIEKKEGQSRTMLELNDVTVKVKEVSLLSINKKTEFNVSSSLTDGGKFNFSGKTIEENGNLLWSIQGSLKQVPAGIFNKIAGDKLPFSFNESFLDANFTARTEDRKVKGEITPEIKRLNLLEEKPGFPSQSIARALTDELTFSLPFTLGDDLTLEYAETYRKLKTYRKYAATESSGTREVPVSQAAETKKSYTFWPF